MCFEMFLPAVNGGQTFIPKRDCKKCVCVWVPHDHVDAENDDDGENDSVADDDVEGSGWVAGW